MNLCVITSSFPANERDARAAAGLFVKDFCLALTEGGHRVTVVTPNKDVEPKDEIPGVAVVWFPWRGGDRRLSYMKPYRPGDALQMLSLLRQGRRTLDRLVAQRPFDHVLAMWAVPAGYLAMGLKKRHRIPFTTWCLGSDIWTYGRYPILRRIIRRVIRAGDLVFADGLKLAEDVERLAGRPCPFLPTSRRLDRSKIRPLNLKEGETRFLFVGRYATVKGVDVLLEAMARYRAQSHRGHLYMLGGGPLDEALRRRASQPDLRGSVTVGGYADEATVVSYLNACDCVVIPSRLESIPVALSDALQMNKPLIVTDVGDMGRLLRETPAGLVVPPEDSGALCEAMVKMSEEDCSQYALSIRTLSQRFDLPRTAMEWIKEVSGEARRTAGL